MAQRLREPDGPEIVVINPETADGWLEADGVGFEPTRRCRLPVFKTGALNRSATHPGDAARRSRPGRGARRPVFGRAARDIMS